MINKKVISKNNHSFNRIQLYFILILMIPLLGFKNNNSLQNDLLITTKARIAVEKAWETYHHGALGGTLPSPTIQTELESKLHRCRELLAEAYEAEDDGNLKKTENLISEILNLSNNVIAESQVPKR